jgi:hypothetical protein
LSEGYCVKNKLHAGTPDIFLRFETNLQILRIESCSGQLQRQTLVLVGQSFAPAELRCNLDEIGIIA